MSADVSCVAHVHSTYSDGRAHVDEIIDAARRAGRDVVLLTDHDTLEARRRGWEGWHDGVLVLVGVEISPRNGHLLAFGVSEEIDHRGLDEEQIVEAVAAAGGLCFAAHPFSQGSRMSTRIGRPHPWGALEHPALTGIELWSLQTDEAEAWRNPREAVRFLRRPESLITGPPERHVGAWDALCRTRPTVAIGGLDAHEPGVRLRGRVRSPMPNDRYFRLLGTHVVLDRPLSGDVERDRAAVYGALGEGRCYLALDGLGPAAGFEFWAARGAERVPMGGEVAGDGWTLHVRLPRAARLAVVRDGDQIAQVSADRIDLPLERAGVHRVEARLLVGGRLRTWLLSNPVYAG